MEGDRIVATTGTQEGATYSGSRGYLAHASCEDANLPEDYMKESLVGKTLSYTTDLSAATCGCNAALYLVSMAQNPDPSSCNDYYCGTCVAPTPPSLSRE